jgi:polysaccharide biosynthesis protein PslH
MNILAIPGLYGFSSPKTGGQNRFSNLLIELKKNGHRIFLLECETFFCSKDTEFAKVYTFKENKIRNREFPTTRDFNKDFILKLFRILKLENINLIQFSHMSGIFAAKSMLKMLTKKIPLIYAAENVESDFVREVIGNNCEYPKLSRILIPTYIQALERISCNLVDYITCVSYNDQSVFLSKYRINDKTISVVFSGCRVPELRNENKIRAKRDVGFEPDKLIVFFHGSYHHPPNREAFSIIKNQIAPKFEEYQNVKFVLGGTEAPIYKGKNIEFIGSIENLQKTIYASDIAIVPLNSGGGTKLKIFDYLSMNLPVITTEKGAQGIDLENNVHALIYKDVDKYFIEALKYLIENENERLMLGNNGRKLAEDRYDWENIGDKLNKLYLNFGATFDD